MNGFSGSIEGQISKQPIGTMSEEEKNKISIRADAFRKFKLYFS